MTKPNFSEVSLPGEEGTAPALVTESPRVPALQRLLVGVRAKRASAIPQATVRPRPSPECAPLAAQLAKLGAAPYRQKGELQSTGQSMAPPPPHRILAESRSRGRPRAESSTEAAGDRSRWPSRWPGYRDLVEILPINTAPAGAWPSSLLRCPRVLERAKE